MERIRKGDTVIVISGKEKGKRGKVLRLIQKTGRVVIERVMMVDELNARVHELEKTYKAQQWSKK